MTTCQTYPRHTTLRWFHCLLLFMQFFWVVGARAQSMRTIATQDGLPQSFVSGIVQDDSFFIWIATRNGLVRFDGVQYKLFQHHTGDTTSLASNFIIWLQRDRQNHLWLEHESGILDEMDPVTEKIIHYLKGGVDHPLDATFIRRGWMVDRDGLFWGVMKGQGVSTFDRQHKKTGYFNRANAGFSSDTARGLAETADHGIWILTKGGLTRFDKKNNRFAHWAIPYTEDYGDFPNSDAIAIDLHERKNGELMWGDRRSLYFFNPLTHIFRKLVIPSVSYLGVRWIRTGPDGSDYFESYGDLFHYDDVSGLSMVGKTIADNFGDAKSFLVDRSGLLWIGTNARGIKQIDLTIPYFKSLPYKKEFVIDLVRNYWGVDFAQLCHWMPEDNLFTQPSYQFRTVYGAHHRLYFSLKATVAYVDSASKKFVKLPELPHGTRITGLAVTPKEDLMVAGVTGNIFQYDPQNRVWKPLLDTGLLRRSFGNSLRPLDILADEKSLWMTTESDGLFAIDLRTLAIRHFQKNQADSFPINELLGLRADPVHPELLWIGSFQGLIRLDKTTFRSRLFSLKEGLPDNTIYSILSDRKGELWLSTNQGICRFEPSTGQVRVFGSRHGLPGDEFNRFHHFQLPDGSLAFGSTTGWTIFDPLMVKKDEFEPQLALTDLRINNREVTASPSNKILRSPLNANSMLTLPFDQNTVSIGFAGLEYSQPQELHYRYRLLGYDNDWVQAGNTHQAIYTKIPPGTYTLLVNASNTSGQWSSYTKAIQLHINSPWWSTTLAYMCYSIILTGLIWTFIRFRVSRTIMKREITISEMETQQLKELDDMKSRFFSNITHEFRTPLTLIIGPAAQLKTEHPDDPRINKLSDGIIHNSKQLLTLVNRLMELAKLESGTAKLLQQRGNPVTLTGLVVQSFETDARTRQVHLLFGDRHVPPDCWFYSDALERIVYNLVSNALKFTEPGGKVEVLLSTDQEHLILTVEDTGVGIPGQQLLYIFDRFYQVAENTRPADGSSDTRSGSDSSSNAGTGIGLAMVKELVNQMGGTIDAQSRTGPSSGTCFTLALPFKTSAGQSENAAARQERSATSARRDPTDQPVSEPADPTSSDLAAPPDPSDKKLQVLLVEDSQELAEFITSILSEQYDVIHSLNGSIGLEQALTAMPDLIVSDVMMPVMNGFEFCRRLKEDIRTSHIPVILLTAKASQEDLITGLTLGANDYLAKPFHPTELLLRIHNLLNAQDKWRERLRLELSQPGAAVIMQGPAIQDVFLTKLYELLEEHLDDAGFGVDQLVDLVNMSRSSLHRKLKSLTGLSTTEVVRNFRLSKAAEMLRQGFNSSDAAYKSGFGSPAYFTKCFREVYGLTPTDFIRQVKQ
jgi:signal transduction histidine kinase/CheY-like chemotaxis protein/ligand-binding sensor domain-containing protein/AraC-like DNA-binding protein